MLSVFFSVIARTMSFHGMSGGVEREPTVTLILLNQMDHKDKEKH